MSDSYAVPSYIGQGTNAYTTSQLARYATAIATSGNVYDLTLLDRQTDSKGNTLKKYEPDIINTVDVSQNVWDDIHDGMYRVVQIHRQFDGLGVDVAGKTGTAEVNVYHQILNMRLQCVLRMDMLPVMRVLQLMIFLNISLN